MKENTLLASTFYTRTNHGQEVAMLPSKDITEMISSCLDEAILNENSKRKKRTYLGGSSLGESCSRKIQYRYMGYEADEGRGFSANTLRIFQFGHEIEDSVAQWLKNANFDLRTEDKKGEQFGFSIADGEIKGHIDGVICGGPVDMGYPCLWENKSANDKKFREFMMKGVARTNPVYAAQIALYQAYMNLTEHPCLFTVLNKNTSQIYYELVPFNKSLAQEMSDKAVNILEATKANEVLPRVAFSKDFFDCKWCEFQDRCWS
jgi:hypothetical protein